MNSRDEMQRLAGLVRDPQLRAPVDRQVILDDLTHNAADSVPGAQYAALTVLCRQSLDTPAATGRFPIVLDEVQNRLREGPCLSAAWVDHTIRIHDLASDKRWPQFRRDALPLTPIRSVLSLRLFADKHRAGVFTYYADHTHAFNDAAPETGLTFASHLSLAWNILQRDKQFRSALASRDAIGQAKGILMERFNLDALTAFKLLKRLSQESNTPVAEIADRLINTEHPPRNRLAP